MFFQTYGNYRQSHHHNQDDYQKDYFDDESEVFVHKKKN